MATLTDSNGRHLGVHSRHLMGRSRRMNTVFDTPEVSAQHAVIAWTGSAWVVRDLGSRNGTTVRGEPIETGIDVPISAGDVIEIGGPMQSVTLTSDEAPAPFAVSADGLVVGEDEILALPSMHDPQVLIQFDDLQGWLMMRDDTATAIVDGATVRVADVTWQIALPEVLDSTVEIHGAPATLSVVQLQFRVSADEEYVEVTVTLPDGPVQLTPRAHHYPLLVLARARLNDAEASKAERGWIYSAQLQKMLRLSSNRVNLGIYRARRELEKLGVANAQDLVERRSTTQQLRLGVTAISVKSL